MTGSAVVADDCIFCKIAAGEIPGDILYRDDFCFVIRDIAPKAPTHLLVIPKKAIATINDIGEDDRELVGHLYWVAGKLAKEMGFDEDGYRTVMNCGENSGQTVFHIHLHLLAGKPMGWPPYTDRMKQA